MALPLFPDLSLSDRTTTKKTKIINCLVSRRDVEQTVSGRYSLSKLILYFFFAASSRSVHRSPSIVFIMRKF